MTDLRPVRKKRRVRIKTRVSDRRSKDPAAGLTRGKVAGVLFLAAITGILLGLILGRGITRMISVHRRQKRIAQSRPAFNPDSPGSAELTSGIEPVESPGR